MAKDLSGSLTASSGGGAVESVNTLTGAVNLGINNLSDVQFDVTTTATVYEFTYAGDSGAAGTGQAKVILNPNTNPPSTDKLRVHETDANGLSVSFSGASTIYLSADELNYVTVTPTSIGTSGSNKILSLDSADEDTYDALGIAVGETLYVSTTDPAPQTVNPSNNEILQYKTANSKFRPASVVNSVNSLTGAVSLGVEELNDFALNQELNLDYSTWSADNTPSAGEWHINSSFFYLPKVDANGVDHSSNFRALDGTTALTITQGGTDYVITNATLFSDQLDDTYQRALITSGSSSGGLIATIEGQITKSGAISIASSSFSGSPIALANGDILQYNSTDSKFKPAQAAGVRSLLGIEEYATDAAAGTGGLSSGELYYNTTSSSYVLKT